jgi:hypothetical protein
MFFIPKVMILKVMVSALVMVAHCGKPPAASCNAETLKLLPVALSIRIVGVRWPRAAAFAINPAHSACTCSGNASNTVTHASAVACRKLPTCRTVAIWNLP